jgi:hypothetical protein
VSVGAGVKVASGVWVAVGVSSNVSVGATVGEEVAISVDVSGTGAVGDVVVSDADGCSANGGSAGPSTGAGDAVGLSERHSGSELFVYKHSPILAQSHWAI